jgi:hypothetical protein
MRESFLWSVQPPRHLRLNLLDRCFLDSPRVWALRWFVRGSRHLAHRLVGSRNRTHLPKVATREGARDHVSQWLAS